MNAVDILVKFIGRIDSQHSIPAKDYDDAIYKLHAMITDSTIVVEGLRRNLQNFSREDRKLAKWAIDTIQTLMDQTNEWIKWYRGELMKFLREQQPEKVTMKIVKVPRKKLKR